MGLLELLIIVLIIMWLLGAWVVPVGGSAIHLLLVIALVIIVVRIARGQRVV
jgi:hypothetical protein